MRRTLLAMLPLAFVLTTADVSAQTPTPAAKAAPTVKVEGKLTIPVTVAPVKPATPAPAAVAPAPAAPKAAAAPASQPVVPTAPPTTAGEAIEQVQTGVAFVKARNWFGMSAVIIFLIMFGLKFTDLYNKMGKRWSYVISAALSVTAMLLAKFAGGVSWEAAWVVLTSGPAMGALSDLVKRGILAKEPETPIKAAPAASTVTPPPPK